MYDVDGFDTSAGEVGTIHGYGARAICYVDVGTSENFRPDFGSFPTSVEGATNGWPGERWLDIRQLSVLEPIMTARLEMCATKGFDAVEPDNVDGYENNTGFALTAADQLAYNGWVASEAHSLGLSVALKNDGDQAATLVTDFDFGIDEQCNQYHECGQWSPFVSAGKAVFNAEYGNGGPSYCASDAVAHLNGATFDLNLQGVTYEPCPPW